MSGKVLSGIMLMFLIIGSCGDSPSGPSGPDYPTPSVLSALFTGGWIPPDTTKGVRKDVQISWTMCPDSSFYRYMLYRSSTPGIENQPDSAEVLQIIHDVSDTVFSDSDVDWDSIYYYALETSNSDSLVSWSNEVSLSILPETSFGGPDAHIKTIDVGAGPGGIVSLPSEDLIYLACYFDNSVYVLEPSYPYVNTVVPLSGGPFDVCATSNYVYVSCSSSDEVSSIRTSDNTMESSVTVGDMPSGLCITPDGEKVYVCCYGSDEVWCLDAATLSVLDTISVDDGPWEICSVPSGDYLYITCRLSGSVQVIRTSDNSVVSTVIAANEPSGICSGFLGEYVYVCDYSMGELVPIRTSDNSVQTGISVNSGPMGVAIVQNGSLAYVSCYLEDRVYFVDLASSMTVGFLPVGTRPNGVCLTSSGEFLFVSNSSSSDVSLFGYSSTK